VRISRYCAVAALSLLGLAAASAPGAAEDQVALIVDKALYKSQGVAGRIERYKADVQARFPVRLRISNKDSFEAYTPKQIRNYIQSQYSRYHIKGVILVGQIKPPLWKNHGQDNKGINSFYYEDLDGTFTDTDGDGYDDQHEWGRHVGPEVWCCWMRPPANTQVASLNAFLDKTHLFYTGDLSYNSRALIAESADYDGNIRGAFKMAERLGAIYGSDIDIDGEGSDPVIASEQIELLNKNRYEIYETMSHASAESQLWDNSKLRTADIRALTGGAIMALIYGCHCAAFNESPSNNIVQAYVFGKGIGQAASGTSWSYGTEAKWYIYEELARGNYLGNAWLSMEVAKNTLQYMKDHDCDPNRHLWGDTLIGSPFIRLKPRPAPAADSSSPSHN
jgi:hypothetical protein